MTKDGDKCRSSVVGLKVSETGTMTTGHSFPNNSNKPPEERRKKENSTKEGEDP
jgi:hypothetical protein